MQVKWDKFSRGLIFADFADFGPIRENKSPRKSGKGPSAKICPREKFEKLSDPRNFYDKKNLVFYRLRATFLQAFTLCRSVLLISHPSFSTFGNKQEKS